MSRTTTVLPTKFNVSRSTSSILLSPSKRRRPNETPSASEVGCGSVKSEGVTPTAPFDDKDVPSPTLSEIHRWTFTRAAIAPCFIRDVLNMRESGSKDMEFFWLGRIPCRTVHLVGLVVGIQVWEKRTVYTIDDGTGVIDCAHAHAQAAPPSPVKPKPRDQIGKDTVRAAGPSSLADYLPSARAPALSTSAIATKRAIPEPPPPPKPVARVGSSVRVIGRVVNRHDTRLLLVDEISRCASSNDGPTHWLIVSDLHRTTYHPTEKLPPFVPPPLPDRSTYSLHHYSESRPGSPSKHATSHHIRDPATPASVRSSIASTDTSPSTSASASSPSSDTGEKQQSPVRLRHPARLHTRDLTVHTLRIYIKHYMDNAPPLGRRRHNGPRARSVSPSPSPRPSQQVASLATPTKRGRGGGARSLDETPRPSRVRHPALGESLHASTTSETDTDTDDEGDDYDDDQVYGYTLSHLRRVPELSLLARRVVQTEAHRQVKEERKKAKAEAKRTQSRDKSRPSSSRTSTAARPTESTFANPKATTAATKRLFRQAIRTLFQDGSIVLWDGPVRPLPAATLDPLIPSSFSSALWKADTSTSSSASRSKSSRSFLSYEEWDEDEPLSDPEPGEEAYVPLSPAYFSRVLERAITRIVAEASAAPTATGATPSDATPKPAQKAPSLIERLRAQEAVEGASVGSAPGPTAAELLAWLRSSDERWARVGLWSVAEALEWGRREGRVWCVGKGRWEVCG